MRATIVKAAIPSEKKNTRKNRKLSNEELLTVEKVEISMLQYTVLFYRIIQKSKNCNNTVL